MCNRLNKYLKERALSFHHAFVGIFFLIKYEKNSQVQATMAIITIIAGILFQISTTEWIVVITFIGLVLAMEAVNSAIEKLSDYACKNQINSNIKIVKDLAAAAVLFVSIAAFIVGVIIFAPKVYSIISSF